MSRAFSSLSCFFISGYSFLVWRSMAWVYFCPRVLRVKLPVVYYRLDKLHFGSLSFSPSSEPKKPPLKSVAICTQRRTTPATKWTMVVV